jgi:hypothetical protein
MQARQGSTRTFRKFKGTHSFIGQQENFDYAQLRPKAGSPLLVIFLGDPEAADAKIHSRWTDGGPVRIPPLAPDAAPSNSYL